MTEKKKGLWANIHAKRKRGERPARPGEKGYPKTLDIEEAKKDTDMYTYKDESKGQVIKGKSGTFVGYTHSATKGKGANILKHNQTKKYYAAGGSSTAFTKKTTLHDTPEDAARAYHKGNLAEEEFNNEAYMGNVKPKKSAHQKFKDSMKRAGYDMDAGAKRLQDLLDRQKKEREDREINSTKSEEASPMIKPPKNEFGKKEDAFAHAKKHGGKVMKKTFTHPTSGMQTVSYVVKEDAEQIDELKRTTLANYVSKAAGSYGRDKQVIGRESPDGTVAKARPELKRAVKNRLTGINRAAERLAKEETEIDEAIKLNSKVKIHAPGKDYHGKVGHVGEIRKGLHDKAPKTYTVDYDYDTKTGNKKSIQLDKSRLKMHNEETEIDEASKKPNATTRHLRDYPVSDKDVAKPITYYSLVHKATNKVLSTHKDLESAKDEHRGMDQGERAHYRIATTTKAPKSFDMTEEAEGVAEETKKMKGKDPCWTGYKMIGTKEKGGRQVPNCVPVKEQMTFRKLREQDNKEVQEYDYEGDMARSDLRSIIMNAKEVHDMLESNTNLPEWVQSKITLSEDYISTVRNYMRSENDNV